MGVNGLGAIATGCVLIDIVCEKWTEGAWIVVVLAGVLFTTFRHIHRYYAILAAALRLDTAPQLSARPGMKPSWWASRACTPVFYQPCAYAREISDNCHAVHVDVDAERTDDLRAAWERMMDHVMPLVVLPSPYRSLLGPLIAYIRQLRQAVPDQTVTVIIPELVPTRWWDFVLHPNLGTLLKWNLLNERGVIVTNVRYYLDDGPPVSEPLCKRSPAGDDEDGGQHSIS